MWNPQDYINSTWLFLRLLGVIYFFAYYPFLFQIKGLIGEKGILPARFLLELYKRRMGNRAYHILPTIFWINCSDKALLGAIWGGLLLSILLIFNICTPIVLLLLLLLHLSIITVGQDFLGFGWESFLIEITLNAIFLSLTPTPNPLIWFSINLLLFRFHFQAGAVKLQSQDANWRNLKANWYHYQSQPLPNTTAWYVHKLPMWFHKFSTALMFFIELFVPFGIFGNDEMRLVVWVFLVGLQLSIWATGNLSYLNYLTAAFCTILLSDHYLSPILGSPPEPASTSLALDIPVGIVGAILITLQLMYLWNHFYPVPLFRKIEYHMWRFHLINRYGIFAIMTTKRYEIVFEGSEDGKEWKEYLFWYKPSELNRRPRRIAPYQPRLDWQAWFLPFQEYSNEVWFQNFLGKLLVGEPDVLALIRHNPFPEKPPNFIRALAYDYTFTDFETKKKTGNWWNRQLVGLYAPTFERRKTED